MFNIVIRLTKMPGQGGDFIRILFHDTRSVIINPMSKSSTGFPNVLLITNLPHDDVYY